MRRLSILSLLMLVVGSLSAQTPEFSQENAYSILRILINDIGPRPMGSPAEQRALTFAVSKFAEYGCQESYVMPFTVAEGVNTKSGIAVGVLKGMTNRIVVIGGHIDSAGPEIPGANDDGSGAASVMEIARVLGKRQNESTVVFCCWGGEEEGLRGSRYFVKNFAQIDSVILMLQLDMADGSGNLEPDPDASFQTSAPRWLVDAAYDIFYNQLHYSGLRYPTHAATLNSSTSGVAGSDHMSFLEKGIPAIDFTSDVSYPIHTPLDNLKNFTPAGLLRSGELVVKLFERFDGGVPSRMTEKYWLVQFGSTPLFFHHWMLWAFVIITLVISIVTCIVAWRKRPKSAIVERVTWSGLKILLLTTIMQTLIWHSENIVGLIRGYRFPWINNFGGFFILGVIFGLLGVWISLQLLRRLRLSTDPSGYYLRACSLLIVLTLLMSLGNAELAVYPASALFLVSLASWVRMKAVKLILIAIAPYLMFRLVFSEFLGLFQRIIVQISWTGVVRNIAFVAFFTLLSLPFIYAFAAVYRDANTDFFWLKKFRSKAGLVAVSVAAVAMVVYLSAQPVYDELWQRSVRVSQRYELGSDSSTISISSGEFLQGLKLKYDSKDTVLTARTTSFTFHPAQKSILPWCSIKALNEAPEGSRNTDSLQQVKRRVELHSIFRPLSVSITYRSSHPINVSSPWSTGGRGTMERQTERVKTFSWYAFPDTSLVVPLTFTLKDTQKVSEAVEVVYDSLSYPLALERGLTYFTKRTILRREEKFGVPQPADRMADEIR